MSSCDVCGKLASMRAVIEGAEVNVCPLCSRFGRVIQASRQQAQFIASREPEVQLIKGYGKAIETSRTALGFSRHDLAKKLNMREADLLHFEEEKVKPAEAEAKKLEAVLKIRLLRSSEQAETEVSAKKAPGKALTLGDVVVIKDKRK